MSTRTTPNKTTPYIQKGRVYLPGHSHEDSFALDSDMWRAWLPSVQRFYVFHEGGNFFCRRESRKRGSTYWSAYRRVNNRAYHTYGGRDEDLTSMTLAAIGERLQMMAQGETKDMQPILYAVPRQEKKFIDPPYIQTISFDATMLWFDLTDGRVIGAPLQWFPRLANADAQQRDHWELVSTRTGVHWPDIDEDISVRVLMNLPS